MAGHSSHWPLSICDTVVSFGTEIWVGIQSSQDAVLSRSDLEKVVHSKFHLTHTERQAGRQALAPKKVKMEEDISQKLAEESIVF